MAAPWSSELTISGLPASPVRVGPPSRSVTRPTAVACSTAESCSMVRRAGVVGSVPGGTSDVKSAGRSPTTPTDIRGIATRPSASATSSMPMKSERVSSPNGTASRSSKIALPLAARRADLQPRATEHERTILVVGKLLVAADAAGHADVAVVSRWPAVSRRQCQRGVCPREDGRCAAPFQQTGEREPIRP